MPPASLGLEPSFPGGGGRVKKPLHFWMSEEFFDAGKVVEADARDGYFSRAGSRVRFDRFRLIGFGHDEILLESCPTSDLVHDREFAGARNGLHDRPGPRLRPTWFVGDLP